MRLRITLLWLAAALQCSMQTFIQQHRFLDARHAASPADFLQKELMLLFLFLRRVLVDDVLNEHVIRQLAITMLLALLVNAYRYASGSMEELHAAISLIHFLPTMPRSAREGFRDIFHADAQLLSSVFQMWGDGDGERHSAIVMRNDKIITDSAPAHSHDVVRCSISCLWPFSISRFRTD